MIINKQPLKMRDIRYNALGALELKLCFVSSFYGNLKLDNLHLLRQKKICNCRKYVISDYRCDIVNEVPIY